MYCGEIELDQGLMMVLRGHVRFGSKADSCSAATHVRFAPNSDHKSGHPKKVMSALPPKADMCTALANVCYGPIADIGPTDPRSVNIHAPCPNSSGKRARRSAPLRPRLLPVCASAV